MKTKIIPFDIELAKKIQSGEIKGRIVTINTRESVRIICFDARRDYGHSVNLIGLIDISDEHEAIERYTVEGKAIGNSPNDDLFIELPEEAPKHEFKPFDKVLVRDCSKDGWQISFFSHIQDDWFITCNGHMYKECIPFEDNEHLIGTTKNIE